MLWAGFLFGLLGSFHCVGMCGAIALALPGRADAAPLRHAGGRLLYNLGRVTTYATLGAGAGLVGHGLRLAGVQQSLSIASGVLILLLVAVPERYSSRVGHLLGLNTPLGWVKTTLGRLFQQASWPALYATGLLNGLLPCGLVYLALAGALSAPGVAGAAAYMACFGLGTLPLMFRFGAGGTVHRARAGAGHSLPEPPTRPAHRQNPRRPTRHGTLLPLAAGFSNSHFNASTNA